MIGWIIIGGVATIVVIIWLKTMFSVGSDHSHFPGLDHLGFRNQNPVDD